MFSDVHSNRLKKIRDSLGNPEDIDHSSLSKDGTSEIIYLKS